MIPFWATVNLFGLGGRDIGLYFTFGQLLSLLPGALGSFCRRAYYLMTLEACARDVGIGFGTWFTKRSVRIAAQVSFGAHCLVGSCSIGEGALFGSNIDILSGRHQHVPLSDASFGLRAQSGNRFERLQIGKNTWIGNRSLIMANVGDNSVIGAGSVVVKDVQANVIAVGNPARVVRNVSATMETSL